MLDYANNHRSTFVKRYLIFITIIAILCAVSFTSLDTIISDLIIAVIAGALGGAIAYFAFKTEKYKNIAAALLIIIIFFCSKIFLLPYYYAATFDYTIKSEYPIYTTIEKYYPKEYNAFLVKMKTSIIKAGGFEDDLRLNSSATLVNYATEKSMPFASSQAIYNYLSVTFQIEKRLFAINPAMILALEYPSRTPDQTLAAVLNTVPQVAMKAILRAKEKVIASGSQNKNPIALSTAEMDKARQNIQQIMAFLTEHYGKETVDDTFYATTPFKDPIKSAQTLLTFYELFLEKGIDEGGALFKVLFMIGKDTGKSQGGG